MLYIRYFCPLSMQCLITIFSYQIFKLLTNVEFDFKLVLKKNFALNYKRLIL